MKHAIKILLPFVLLLAGGCASSARSPVATHVATDVATDVATEAAFVDPNCAVTVVAGNAFPNRYAAALTPAQQTDATNAIAALTFGNLYRNPPYRISGPANLVRLDVQGAIAGNGRNWQVQINNINGASTIATMLIDATAGGASTPDRQSFVQRSARNALVQSLATGNTYQVNGPCQ